MTANDGFNQCWGIEERGTTAPTNLLAVKCPCGHAANYHPTLVQQISAHATCRGGSSSQYITRDTCQCITNREQVISDGCAP